MKKYIFMIFVLAEIITAQDTAECEIFNNLLLSQKNMDFLRIILGKSFCGSDVKNRKGTIEDETGQSTDESIENIDPSNPLLLSILPSNKICGKIMNNNNNRILSKRPVILGDWPWMVAIGYKRPDQRNPKIYWGCAGTLITNRHVLTAAHCLVNLGGLKPTVARLGDLDLDTDVNDGATPIDILIDRIITHENYRRDGKQTNDIALLILKDKVTFNDHIQPICLPCKSDVNINYEKTPTVAGWGSTNPSQMFDRVLTPNTKLMDAELPFIHNEKCKTVYNDTATVMIDDNVICAGFLDGNRDTCQGDSGGPLMIKKQPQYYIMGVVSYTPRLCGIPDKPVVYTRVPSFINWILRKLIQN